MSSTAMTKAGDLLPAHPLARVEDLRDQFHQLEGKVNLVSPVASVDSIPAMHGISLRAVRIDSTVNQFNQGPEVYRDARFCEKNERALGGVALQKIAAAAGVQILGRDRRDDRSDPYYCEIEVTIGVRDFDGTWRQVTKAKEIDLRDGAPETLKPEKLEQGGRWEKTGRMVPLDPSALGDKRRHIQSLAETKAFYRALRTILTLKQKYTTEELSRPFVVPKLVPALDPNDPDQKKALIDMATGAETRLFGNRGNAAPAGEPARQLRDVTPPPALAAPAGPPAMPATTAASVADDPDDDGGDDQAGDDFEPLDLTPPQPVVCGCPCSCQKELTPEVAEQTTKAYGAPRCGACFPGVKFKYEQHKGLRTLGLPGKHANLTADAVKAALERRAAK